ncbi:MAG: RdgB/HAM1 family non-canonical purine NTP pyrophosphatase [Promethearchaeota archaeon]|nr:MAG: RdgB/HAM1 family non-canonical purine NTP pyrophosphatase [Candidatus Lokiarchaeota archaeon]
MNEDQKLIYFVTGNIHKFNEISDLFNKENVDYILKQKPIETIEIQAESIKEVALFKLDSIRGQIDGSYFVEDAGFFIDTPLNGFPGVYSSYIMKTIGNKGILRLINDFEYSKAQFVSIIALYFKPLDKNFFFEGKIHGKVSKTIRGSGGFGFDPIFLPNIMPNKTFAELTTEEKNKISHRGQAWRNFIKFLRENNY